MLEGGYMYNIGVNALFILTFWGHFYSGPYISILPLLVPKPINVILVLSVSQQTEIADVANSTLK